MDLAFFAYLESGSVMNLDAGLTRAQAAQFLRVPGSTVSMWALSGWLAPDGSRRQLTVMGRGPRKVRLYRLGDLLEAERDTRNNPNSRRRAPGPFLAA